MKKVNRLISLLLLFLCINIASIPVHIGHFSYSSIAIATDGTELDIQTQPPTDDTKELYDRYKDNSFNLMNKEYKSINKINQFMQNFFLSIKNFFFQAVVASGKLNMVLVNTLFDLNIANAIKDPIQTLSLSYSGNIVSLASTIGVIAIAIFMITKLMSTGQPAQAMKVFGIGLCSFVVLTTFNQPSANHYFFSGIIEVDNQIENALAGLNPQFTENKLEGETVGEKIASDVFRTNIYEPYLYLSYGTTNTNEIRKKTVEYKGKDYDRIGAVLDNDSASEKQVVFIEKVTDYEVDKLSNDNPSYKKALGQSFVAILYLCSNLFQLVIFGLLGLFRLALQFLLIVLPLFLPIIMILGMILEGTSLLGHFFKGYMTISFMKASLSLITVVFINYVALAYTMDLSSDSVLVAVITRIAWIVAPVFVYKFRYLIMGIFSPRIRVSSGGLMESFRHPNRASDRVRQNRDATKEQRQQAREKRKQQQEKNESKNKRGKKDKLNEVTPKNAQFSSERTKGKANTKTNHKGDNNNTDKDNSHKEIAQQEKTNQIKAEGSNDGTKKPKRTVARNERANKNEQATPNKEKVNQPKLNKKENTETSKQPTSDIRKERVKKHQDNEKKEHNQASKGKVTPVKNGQTTKRIDRTKKDLPNSSEGNKQTLDASDKKRLNKRELNKKAFPKKMVQPTKKNQVKQMKSNFIIKSKGSTINKNKMSKIDPKFSLPNKKKKGVE